MCAADGGVIKPRIPSTKQFKKLNFTAPTRLFEHVETLVAETGSAVPPIDASVSDEVSDMLRRCFESDVSRRPTALELLRTEPFLRLPTHDGAPERTSAAGTSEEPRASSDVEDALEFGPTSSNSAGGSQVEGTAAGMVSNLDETPVEAERTLQVAAGPSKDSASPREPSSASSIVRFADGAALTARPPEQPNPFARPAAAKRGRRVTKADGAVSESPASGARSRASTRANRGVNASSTGQSSRPGPPRMPALEAALRHQVIP